MKKSLVKEHRKIRRRGRIRAKISGTSKRPRLAIFRSNRYVYAQLIDDVNGATLVSADSRETEGKNRTEKAEAVGAEIAKRAQEKGIEQVVFDRGGFHYQGIVASLAEGARKGGLVF